MTGDVGNPAKHPPVSVVALHLSIDLIDNKFAAGKPAAGTDESPRVDKCLGHNLT